VLLAALDSFRRFNLHAVTLSTFKDIAWNEPFYHRRGFASMGNDDLPLHLQQIREQEKQSGLPIEKRVCMQYRF
jgi:hypothetical protein